MIYFCAKIECNLLIDIPRKRLECFLRGRKRERKRKRERMFDETKRERRKNVFWGINEEIMFLRMKREREIQTEREIELFEKDVCNGRKNAF